MMMMQSPTEVKFAPQFFETYLKTGLYTDQEIELFANHFVSVLTQRYHGHWNQGHPERGSGFRSLQILDKNLDPTMSEIFRSAGLDPSRFLKTLPQDITMWIDPGEVAVRAGNRFAHIITIYQDDSRQARQLGHSDPTNVPSMATSSSQPPCKMVSSHAMSSSSSSMSSSPESSHNKMNGDCISQTGTKPQHRQATLRSKGTINSGVNGQSKKRDYGNVLQTAECNGIPLAQCNVPGEVAQANSIIHNRPVSQQIRSSVNGYQLQFNNCLSKSQPEISLEGSMQTSRSSDQYNRRNSDGSSGGNSNPMATTSQWSAFHPRSAPSSPPYFDSQHSSQQSNARNVTSGGSKRLAWLNNDYNHHNHHQGTDASQTSGNMATTMMMASADEFNAGVSANGNMMAAFQHHVSNAQMQIPDHYSAHSSLQNNNNNNNANASSSAMFFTGQHQQQQHQPKRMFYQTTQPTSNGVSNCEVTNGHGQSAMADARYLDNQSVYHHQQANQAMHFASMMVAAGHLGEMDNQQRNDHQHAMIGKIIPSTAYNTLSPGSHQHHHHQQQHQNNNAHQQAFSYDFGTAAQFLGNNGPQQSGGSSSCSSPLFPVAMAAAALSHSLEMHAYHHNSSMAASVPQHQNNICAMIPSPQPSSPYHCPLPVR